MNSAVASEGDRMVEANKAEITVSSALSGIAVGFVMLIYNQGMSSIKELSGATGTFLLLLLFISLGLCVTSIVFGGLGITRPLRPGPGNAFDKQSKFLIAGAAMLAVVLASSALSQKSSNASLKTRVAALENELENRQRMNAEKLDNVLNEMNALRLESSEFNSSVKLQLQELENRIENKPPAEENPK